MAMLNNQMVSIFSRPWCLPGSRCINQLLAQPVAGSSKIHHRSHKRHGVPHKKGHRRMGSSLTKHGFKTQINWITNQKDGGSILSNGHWSAEHGDIMIVWVCLVWEATLCTWIGTTSLLTLNTVQEPIVGQKLNVRFPTAQKQNQKSLPFLPYPSYFMVSFHL